MWNHQSPAASQHASGAQDWASRTQQAADDGLQRQERMADERSRYSGHVYVPPLTEEQCEVLRCKVLERERLYSEYLRLNREADMLRRQAQQCFSDASDIRSECEKLACFDGNYRPDVDQQLWGNPLGKQVYSAQFTLPSHIGKSHRPEAASEERKLRYKTFGEEN